MQSSQKSTANDFPLYLFHQGKNFEAHKFFGAHPFRRGRGQFYRFRVWAPHAKSVSVIGEFNGWNRTANPMHKISDTVWEAELPRLKQFAINTASRHRTVAFWTRQTLMPHTMSAGPAPPPSCLKVNMYGETGNGCWKRKNTSPTKAP